MSMSDDNVGLKKQILCSGGVKILSSIHENLKEEELKEKFTCLLNFLKRDEETARRDSSTL